MTIKHDGSAFAARGRALEEAFFQARDHELLEKMRGELESFEESKKLAYKRMENPRIVPLAWFRSFVEEQEEIFGSDPWVYGLGEANRKNVETLMQYSYEQGLIGMKMALEQLFIDTTAHPTSTVAALSSVRTTPASHST